MARSFLIRTGWWANGNRCGLACTSAAVLVREMGWDRQVNMGGMGSGNKPQ